MPALELTEGLLGIHTKREFYGFDYTELALAWGLKLVNQLNWNSKDIVTIKDYMLSKIHTREQKKIASDLRKFIKEMRKRHPEKFLDNLLKIKDKAEFIKNTAEMLPRMWF